VQAQSVDDPTKSGTFLFNVCAKTTTVMVAPAYQQAFMGQHRTLQSWVSGDSDETGTWSIVAQPSGGNGLLADTTNRDADFVATVTGRYTLQYTSHSNPAKSATAIVYVSPNPLPAYASTPSKTEPRECYADPALTGGDFEVGAGKPYPTLSSTPAAGTLAPGSIIRVWNTDASGSNPSTYHEYYQIAATGTPTEPMILCGVADSQGNLPVIDGSNATGQPGISTDGAAAGAGVISVWEPFNGQGTPDGFWQNGSAGPSYVTVTGLHIVHGTPNYNYTPPGGGAAMAYSAFTACLNIRSGSYIDLGGNHLDTCGLGLFTDDNGNSGWVTITQLVTMTGSHIQNAGISGSATEHGAYVQTWYALLQGNLFDNYNLQAGGSDVKWRGVEGIFRYNNIASGAARLFDLVDEQDAPAFVTFETYLGLPGETNCYESVYCPGDTAGPNIIAGYQESFQKDFIYGNELFGTSTQQQIHYLADGGGGMNDRNGTLYFYSNTLDAAQEIFDTGSNGDRINSYLPQRIDARNNIFWGNHAPYNGAQDQMAFGTESTIVMSATTNLMKAGTFTIQTPIEGAPWQNNTAEGWSNGCDGVCYWPLTVPLDGHLYGLTNANFLSTATQPYDPNTMVPPAGSAAINAGAVLTGVLQTMPVRWQYSIATNSLIPRLNPQTIGAVDFAAEAAAPSFSPSGGDYATAPTVTLETTTPSATIYYTTDGSTPTFPATGTTKLYGGPITVATSETVQAIAVATGFVQSTVASAAYGVGPQAATPVFSPAGGAYTAVQTVTISDTTAGVAIYYTTDGSAPTSPATGTTQLYSGPLTVATNETLQALATASGFSNSNVNSATYTINIPQTSQPTFTPAGGTYSATQTVTISDATTGAAIYYTTDGSTPTFPVTGTAKLYAGPITVSASQTLAAISVATGDSPSAVAKAAYSITAPFTGPVTVQQCNNFVQFGSTVSCTLSGVGAGHTLVIGIGDLAPGQTGTATSSSGKPLFVTADGNFLSAWVLPNTSAGSNTITYTVATSSRLWLSVVEYNNTAASPLDGVGEAYLTSWQGNGSINTPTFTTSSSSDALWSLCWGSAVAPTAGTLPVAWTGLPTPSGGNLLVESGNAGGAGLYYGQCGSNEGEIVSLALQPASALAQTATPTLSPVGGTYTTAQSVTISDSTPGATIYYTTNGTTPTIGSNVYSGPINVSASETVAAIAVSSSTTQSAVASAVFAIDAPGATPPITWATPAAIGYGTALGSAQLNAISTAAGTFSYSPPAGTVLTAGNHTLTATFNPTNTTAYTTTTTSVNLVVNKATPAITWATPAAIPYGTALSAAQLNATSTVGGSFTYSPALGVVLAAGSETLTTTFSPTDTTDYISSTASVTLSVIPPGTSPVFVQQCNQYNPFGTTVSCTLSGVSAGHTLVIGIAGAATIPGTVITSAGNAKLVVQDGSFMSGYLLANTKAGNISITYTATTSTKIHMSVAEYGNTAASPLDGVTSIVNKGYSSAVTTATFKTTTTSDLLWSFCGAPGGTTINPGTAPIAWTKRVSPNGTGMALLVEDGVTRSAGPYFGQCTGTNELLEMVTIALKP
jgi:hypothetical protein